MAEDISPTVARRHLRLALREAREAANLTQLEVAEQMEWSLSKVIRIENEVEAAKPPPPTVGQFGAGDMATTSQKPITEQPTTGSKGKPPPQVKKPS